MDEDLEPIDKQLTALEQALVAEYALRRRKAQRDGSAFVTLPPQRTQVYVARVAALQEALYANDGTGSLRIVSELHDELRIRMVHLRNLLARDIPDRYLERALAELADEEPPAQPAPAAAVPRAAVAPAAPRPAGAAGGLLGWLARWLGRGGRTGTRGQAATAAVAVAEPRPAPASAGSAAEAEPLPENMLRLLVLHRLMEEDELGLVKDGQQLAPTGEGVRLPARLAGFYARDVAAVHFATRRKSEIARTPEELRRKLAARAQQASAKREADQGR